MWIKPFSADGQPYVYSAWGNQIARVSPRLHAVLTGATSLEEKRQAAVRLGLLPRQTPSVEVFPDAMIAEAVEDIRRTGPDHLVLTVTEACNFRCRYCIYSGAYVHARRHSHASMSETTAIAAVRWYFGFPRDHYHIGFYGGEPLLQQKLIKTAVHAARENLPAGAGLSLGMTTNAWLLEDAMELLAENQMDVFVSLDGPDFVHDRYRRTVGDEPTFHRVWHTLKRMRRQYPDYFQRHVNFSITLAPPQSAAEIEGFMEQNHEVFMGKVPRIGILDTAPSDLAHSLGVGGMPTIDLSGPRQAYLRDRVEGKPPSGFGRACAEAAMARIHNRNMRTVDRLETKAGQCLPGKRCHVTPDGLMHMCEHGDERMPIGKVGTGFDLGGIAALLRRFRDFAQPRCGSCWAVRLCGKCLRQLAAGPDLSDERFAALCALRRKSLERDLADYCWARSRNDRCFESLADGGETR